jgi:tetratricopeptide (TPR) repeat protein
MFSPVVSEIIKQELENEARELETKIAELEVALQRASETSHTNRLKGSYEQWENYQDIEELEAELKTANNQLSKLKDRIGTLHNDNVKTCSHRFACQCSGDKSAEREVVAMGTSKRLEEMKSFKEQGNTFFGEKKYREALALYEKALIYFEYCFDGTADERMRADELRLWCLLNAGRCQHYTIFIFAIAIVISHNLQITAACFHHLNMHKRCIEYCNDALEIDNRSIKALFRRARAYRLQDKVDDAQADLVQLKSLVSARADKMQVEIEMELLMDCRRDYRSAAKQFARRAMSERYEDQTRREEQLKRSR